MLNTIRALWPLLREFPWTIPVVVLLGTLSSLLEGLGLSLFIPLVGQLQEGGQGVPDTEVLGGVFQFLLERIPAGRELLVLAVLIFLAILLRNLLDYGLRTLFAWVNSRIGHRLRCDIFEQLLGVSYRDLRRQTSGDLLNTLANESWRTTRALENVLNLLMSASTVLVFGAIMALISWQLSLLVAVVMVGISGLIHLATRRSRHMSERAVTANRRLTERMLGTLEGMRVIRTLGAEPFETERFGRASERVRRTFFQLDLLSGLVSPLSEILFAGLLLGILAFGLQQGEALPGMVAFLLLLFRLQPHVRNLDAYRVALMGHRGSVEDVMAFLDRPREAHRPSRTRPVPDLRENIRFDDVTLRYPGSEEPALHRIDVTLPARSVTALVGRSGAGKSSVVNLLTRLYDPDEGEVRVDGTPLRQLDLRAWRSRLAIAGQQTYLFADTVRANIAYGDPDADREAVEQAARNAAADGFVEALPRGYETRLEAGGRDLSGGQRQRIALARTFLRDAQLVILDEAMSELDNLSERRIWDAIARMKERATVIVVAHRLSTIRGADRILVLEGGRLAEEGTFTELLDRDGLFARLYEVERMERDLGGEGVS